MLVLQFEFVGSSSSESVQALFKSVQALFELEEVISYLLLEFGYPCGCMCMYICISVCVFGK